MEYVTRNKFPEPVKRNDVLQSWVARGYSCDLYVDPPGREWNDFMHEVNELVTVVNGKLRIIIAGEQMIASPGDEVFIPKGANHSVQNIHTDTTYWLYGYG